ncbi:hypothetical protein NA8A_08359 [Nitratireductor indicus C115]|uniref:Uncharacterized protein n=1 Tax=Nitratireductor indicus C115 TaxID=1231190 RepID=K2NTQ4_9HYPH|nr:hypothetical protein NA8A_08359 [Nitratireductor indicus C115]
MSAIYPAIFTGIRQIMFIAGAHKGVGQEGGWCGYGVAALTAPVQQCAPQFTSIPPGIGLSVVQKGHSEPRSNEYEHTAANIRVQI